MAYVLLFFGQRGGPRVVTVVMGPAATAPINVTAAATSALSASCFYSITITPTDPSRKERASNLVATDAFAAGITAPSLPPAGYPIVCLMAVFAERMAGVMNTGNAWRGVKGVDGKGSPLCPKNWRDIANPGK